MSNPNENSYQVVRSFVAAESSIASAVQSASNQCTDWLLGNPYAVVEQLQTSTIQQMQMGINLYIITIIVRMPDDEPDEGKS